MKFLVVYDKAPNNYCAFVPGLPVVCISTGATVQEIEQNIREAMDGHIELMVLDGNPLDESSSWAEDIEILTAECSSAQRHSVTFEESCINCAALVPGMPGAVAVGDTVKEARQQVSEFIEFRRNGLAPSEESDYAPECWAEIVEVNVPVRADVIPTVGA